MKSIQIEKVSKAYGSKKDRVEALRDINLEVEEGEIFGLIGPDGAGKTSLFRILTTLLLADEGRASVAGFDVEKDFREIRKIVGYMPGKFSLYQDLSVQENLDFFATIFNTTVEENYHLIKDIYVQLEPFRDRRAGALSGGMKQKLALCCALVHRPTVLFLDEPTTGVDVVSRREFWEMLQRLKSQNITIFASTPYMDEATLCDRIGLIQNGRILSVNTPEGLLQEYAYPLWAIRTDKMYHAMKDLLQMPGVEQCHAFGEYHHLRFDQSLSSDQIERYLVAKGHDNIALHAIQPTVEDCFLELMQREK